MKIVLKMNNNLTSGKVVRMSSADQQNNQIITNSQIINGTILNNNHQLRTMSNCVTAGQTSSSNLISNLTLVNGQQKGVIERGASWSYNETRALLSLWGQDMVQRQLTNSKRTRHVWEKIAEKLGDLGYSRSPDQVRTRVFNMIAEYRRILKNPTPERKKKCTFFEALQKIYQAKDASQVRQACRTLDNCDDMTEMIDFNGEEQESYLMNNWQVDNLNSAETSDLEDKEIFSYTLSPSHFNTNNQFNQISNLHMNGLNHQVVHFNNGSNIRNRSPTSFSNAQSLNANLNTSDPLNQLDQQINQAATIQHLKQIDSQTNSLNGDQYYSDNHSENSRDQFIGRFTTTNNMQSIDANRTIINQARNMNNKLAKQTNDSQQNKRLKTDDCEHQRENDLNMQADSYVNTIDTTTLLIDKMFEHLAHGTDAMKEWIKLEERRLEQDIIRRQKDREREERREQKYLEAFVKMQSQMFEFLSKRTTNVDEAKNLNLIDNLRDEINESIHKEQSETDRIMKTFNDSNEEIEDKLTNKSDGTVSATDDITDLDSLAPENAIHTTKTNSIELSRVGQLSSAATNSTSVIEEQNQQTQPVNQVTLESLLQSTSHLNDTLLQSTSTHSTEQLDRGYYSLLAHPIQSKIVLGQERMNSQIVDLEYAYKDDHECNNYNFTNVQHEEIVN